MTPQSEDAGEVFLGFSPSLGSAGAVAGDLAGISWKPHMEKRMALELGPFLSSVYPFDLARNNTPQVPSELCEHPTALEYVTGLCLATLYRLTVMAKLW